MTQNTLRGRGVSLADAQPETGLLRDFRQAVNRLRVGEFTLIIRNGKVIRIERRGQLCVYCEIPVVSGDTLLGSAPDDLDEGFAIEACPSAACG